jgi:hypothetical protein
MKVALAGASGFLGNALAKSLIADGHRVARLIRRAPSTPSEVQWAPESGQLDQAVLAGVDVVVCLSGAGIEDRRWTSAYRRELLDSRVGPVSTIATTLAAMDPTHRPASFVTASAVGFYGDRGDEQLDENSGVGHGFLAELVQLWEAAAAPATAAGVRTASLRTGLVLAASDGLLHRLLPIFKLGAGGRLGSGRQYQPWISLADEIGAIRHVIDDQTLAGPVNITGPDPVTNRKFVAELASVVHRPALIPAPVFGLKAVLGPFAEEGALFSQRAVPHKLLASGYQFQHRTVREALEWAVQN